MSSRHPAPLTLLSLVQQHQHWQRNQLQQCDALAQQSSPWLQSPAWLDWIGQARTHLQQQQPRLALVYEPGDTISNLLNALLPRDLPLPQRINQLQFPLEISASQHTAALHLLPWQTHYSVTPLADYRDHLDNWQHLLLRDSRQIHSAIQQAQQHDTLSADALAALLSEVMDGRPQISHWRYGQLSLPHPLLQEGLSLLLIPGLRAFDSEPELLTQLQDYQVIWRLNASRGITSRQQHLWRHYLAPLEQEQDSQALILIDDMEHLAQDTRNPLTPWAQQLGISSSRFLPIASAQAQGPAPSPSSQLPWLLQRLSLQLLAKHSRRWRQAWQKPCQAIIALSVQLQQHYQRHLRQLQQRPEPQLALQAWQDFQAYLHTWQAIPNPSLIPPPKPLNSSQLCHLHDADAILGWIQHTSHTLTQLKHALQQEHKQLQRALKYGGLSGYSLLHDDMLPYLGQMEQQLHNLAQSWYHTQQHLQTHNLLIRQWALSLMQWWEQHYQHLQHWQAMRHQLRHALAEQVQHWISDTLNTSRQQPKQTLPPARSQAPAPELMQCYQHLSQPHWHACHPYRHRSTAPIPQTTLDA